MEVRLAPVPSAQHPRLGPPRIDPSARTPLDVGLLGLAPSDRPLSAQSLSSCCTLLHPAAPCCTLLHSAAPCCVCLAAPELGTLHSAFAYSGACSLRRSGTQASDQALSRRPLRSLVASFFAHALSHPQRSLPLWTRPFWRLVAFVALALGHSYICRHACCCACHCACFCACCCAY
jgi:hypothetical protein